MTLSPELLKRLGRWRNAGMLCGAIGCAACLWGWFSVPDQFYSAWLTAFVYWLGLTLGCLGMALVHGMSGGAWGRTLRRVLEAGYQTLPLMALLFIPLWLGAARIYEWADPEFVRLHEVVQKKSGYLNVAGFQIRAIVYFGVWIISAWLINRVSPDAEPALETSRSRILQVRSGLCCIAYGFTMTFAAVDWVMSLEPEWYSTMYGLLHFAGQAVAGLSLGLLVVTALREFEPWSRLIAPDRLQDIGNLLLASVMFWAYCSFFQFLVIWLGNLPEENVWYIHRSRNGWQYLALVVLGLHFVAPFLLLLSRRQKRQARDLGRITALLLAMRYADLYWLIAPGIPTHHASSAGDATHHGFTFHWLDVAAFVAIGGLWLSCFAWRLSIRAAVPLYDPESENLRDERSRTPLLA